MTLVVIMAGGLGQRLRPLTDHAPKSMLPVGGKPMIEEVIDQFVEQGFKDFILTTCYKAELIEEYFGDGSWKGVNISYLREETPQGTAGALRNVSSWGPFIVCNSDVQTHIDYEDLLNHHARSGCEATMCLARYQEQIHFGVAKIKDDVVEAIEEKPIYDYWVSAGINVLEPHLLDAIPDGPYNMPDLLMSTRPSAYHIMGFWADLGTFEAYNGAK